MARRKPTTIIAAPVSNLPSLKRQTAFYRFLATPELLEHILQLSPEAQTSLPNP